MSAEAALSAAVAAERRANEKLAREQSRLAEALTINNALTQHLKQVVMLAVDLINSAKFTV
jgi:hypothetical protein